ncbi:MAG: hypothetical protein LQ351_006512 [Letrouitia transgressa]|nr:MAG: hypothetical protein LQ351_006512 [Letrouitia transgressa]
MFFVVFELNLPASRTPVSMEYYAKLQSILQTQAGFISEVPYASPHREGRQVLVAKFVDEASVRAWRLQHDHLIIQYHARREVFDDYRLRVGPSTSLDREEGEVSEGAEHVTRKKGHIICLYERPILAAEDTADPSSIPSNVVDLVDREAQKDPSLKDVIASLVDTTVYQSEKTMLWISGWVDKDAAVGFGHLVSRTQGDSIQLVRVERDYGKYDRNEAPEGADAAQAASVPAQGDESKGPGA